MKPGVYLETTIVSYLAARPSRDLVIVAHQQITREWWENKRDDFDLYAAQLVIQEASAGDAEAARKRLEILAPLPLLVVTPAAIALARSLTTNGPLPKKAGADALHIAIAATNGLDYLLTWNCKHIANAQMYTAVALKCRAAGFEPPVICTPEELLGE